MVIVSFAKPIDFHGWKFTPGTRYVASEGLWRKVCSDNWKEGEPELTLSWSHFASYERRVNMALDLNGRRIAIYREAGFGDNLMVTAVARYIKERYPQCQIDHYATPAVAEVWDNNTDISFIGSPPVFESVKRYYDYTLFLEGMIENDTEPDQENCYDNLYRAIGEYAPSVSAAFKHPQIFWGENDKKQDEAWQQQMPRRYVLVHWNASLSNRTYPHHLMRKVISGLGETVPVVLVGETSGGCEQAGLFTNRNVSNCVDKIPKFRALLPMIQHASAVICPDSAILHAAAAFQDVPVVSLWGPYAHADRAKYYPNQHPMDAHDTCPSSPCRFGKLLPLHKCQQAAAYEEGTRWCSAMVAIAPEKIIERTLSVMV